MKNRVLAVMLAAVMVVSAVSVAAAAEDFNRWGVGLQMMFLNPDTDEELGLVSAEDTMTGGLTLEYFLTPNFSAELVAAIAHVDLQVAKNHVGSGEAWLLPPSLYIKYHPMPQWKISPYIGAGVDWIYAWDESVTLPGLGMGTTSLNIDPSFGWAAKVGADIKITDHLFANIDVMYLQNETEMDIQNVARNVDLDIKVWSYNVGMRYRF